MHIISSGKNLSACLRLHNPGLLLSTIPSRLWSSFSSVSSDMADSSNRIVPPAHQKKLVQLHNNIPLQATTPSLHITHALSHVLSLFNCRIHEYSFVSFDIDEGIVPSIITNNKIHTRIGNSKIIYRSLQNYTNQQYVEKVLPALPSHKQNLCSFQKNT